MLLTADFGRQGTDLVLVGDDGETIIVRDYFSTDSPPTRLTASGARITGDLAGKLAGPADPTQVAQAGAGGAAAAIGRVDTADGAITITRANGDEVDGTVGTPIFQGDVVETKVGGSLGIVFADETTFSLGESGRMVIDEMVYDPAGESGSASLSVVQGVFAFVSGKIAKTGIDAMTVSTPVATIGIRGTTVSGQAQQEGAANTITLLQDSSGAIGQISVSTSVGVLVLSAPFQSTQVVSAFSPPVPPVILPAAVVQQIYGNVAASVTSAVPSAGAGGGATGGDTPGGAAALGDAAAANVDAAASNALADALAGGATLDQAFAAATEAGTAAAQNAFNNALAGGLSEAEALQAAGGNSLSGIVTDQLSISGLTEGFSEAITGSDNPAAVGSVAGAVAGAVNGVQETIGDVVNDIVNAIQDSIGFDIGGIGGGAIQVVGSDLAGGLGAAFGGDGFGGDGVGDGFGDGFGGDGFGDGFGSTGGFDFGAPPPDVDLPPGDIDDIIPPDLPPPPESTLAGLAAAQQALAAATEAALANAINSLVASFTGSGGGGTTQNVSGSSPVNISLTPGVDDTIIGDSQSQVITLLATTVGPFDIGAEIGDSVTGGGGTDGVVLPTTFNVLQVNDIGALTIPRSTDDTQAIQFGTAGTMNINLGSGSNPPSPLLISGVGSGGSNDLAQTLNFNFALDGNNPTAFALSGGTDTVQLAVGTNNILGVLDTENVNFANGSSGASTINFTLPVGNATSLTIGGLNGSSNTLTLNLSSIGPNQVTLGGEITANGGAFSDTFKIASSNLGEGTKITGGGGVDTVEIFSGQSASFTGSGTDLTGVEILTNTDTGGASTFTLDAADLSGLLQITSLSSGSSVSVQSTTVDFTNVEVLTNVTTLTGGTGTTATITLDDVNLAALTSVNANGTATISVGSDTTVNLTNLATTTNVAAVTSTGADTAFVVDDVNLATNGFTSFTSGGSNGILSIVGDATVDLTNVATLSNVTVATSTGTNTTFTVDDANLSALSTLSSAGSTGTIDGGSDTTIDLTNLNSLSGINSFTSTGSGLTLTVDAVNLNALNSFTIGSAGTLQLSGTNTNFNAVGKTFTNFTTVNITDGSTVTLDSTTGETSVTTVNGVAGGSTEAIVFSSGNADLTGTTFNNIETFTVSQANTAQTLTVDGSADFNGMDFVGTEEGDNDAFFDDIVANTGNVDFSDVSLTNIGVLLANNTSLSQTVSTNAHSQLFDAHIENFDGSGGTNDIFDYVSSLVDGEGTTITAGTAVTLTEQNSLATGTGLLSGNTTGAVEFDYSQAFLNLDIQNSTAATIVGNIEAILESATISSGGALIGASVNADMLLIFYEASSQGTTQDAVIARYQEGGSSENDFNGEISLLADFEGVAQGAFADASFN